MKWFYVIAVVLVAGLVASPFALLPNVEIPVGPDEVLSLGTYGAKIRSIDPGTCGDTTSAGLQGSIFEGLYNYHYLKRPVELEPLLAAEMPKVSEDGLVYTIRLREGVRYHRNECFPEGPDGIRTREVEAKDFVLAFKRIADAKIKTSLAYTFLQNVKGIKEFHDKTRTYTKEDFSRYDLPIEGVRAVDNHTLQIELTQPFPQFRYVLALHNYAPFPREAMEHYLIPSGEPEIGTPEAVIGTGAYYLAERKRGDRYVLRRNPDFRTMLYPREGEPGDREAGLLADAGERLPFVDVVLRRFVPESNPMWMLFLTRQVDTAGIPPDQYDAVITPDKTLTDGLKDQGIRLIKYSPPSIYWIAFNMDDPVVGASKSLRQAIWLGYNVEEFIELIRNGRAIRATTFVPSTLEGHDEAPSRYARYDLKAARAKLEDARRELVAAGVIPAGGDVPALMLSFGGQDEMSRKMGDFAVRQFRNMGLTLKIELNQWTTLQEKVDNGSVQMYSMGWHADYPDPENFLQLYYGPNRARGTNNTNYHNPTFDRLYEQASVMPPSPERTNLYVRMLKILNEDCPCVPVNEPIGFFLVHPWVRNVKPHPIGYGFMKCQRIDAALRARMGGG